jgi:Fe-S cluster biogenesis protein NfuA
MNSILLILGFCILGASLFLTIDSVPGPAYSEKEMGNVRFLSWIFRGKDHHGIDRNNFYFVFDRFFYYLYYFPSDLNLVLTLYQVLSEIRPYLAGTGGGELKFIGIRGSILKVQIKGPAARVNTIRVAITRKLREKIPFITTVRLLS